MSSLFDEMMEEICEKNQKISDLEAKLEEKDKAIENWQTMYESVVRTCHNDKEKIERLNKQLAEKNKEIENIKLCRCVNCKNEYEFMLEGLVEDLEKQVDKDDQDKTSFAVEKLEKVKEVCSQVWGMEYAVEAIEDYIDDQIKQLKEGE